MLRAITSFTLRLVEEVDRLLGVNLEPLGRRAGADRIDAAQEMYRGIAQCGQNLGGPPLRTRQWSSSNGV